MSERVRLFNSPAHPAKDGRAWCIQIAEVEHYYKSKEAMKALADLRLQISRKRPGQDARMQLLTPGGYVELHSGDVDDVAQALEGLVNMALILPMD